MYQPGAAVFDVGTEIVSCGWAKDQDVTCFESDMNATPIENGIVKNWDFFEKTLHRAFYDKLRTAPEERHLLLAEAPNNPPQNREKTTQLIFETFHCYGYCLAPSSTLACYSAHQMTGISVGLGAGLGTVAPVYEGLTMRDNVKSLRVGGTMLTEMMIELMCKDPVKKPLVTPRIAKHIKESVSYFDPPSTGVVSTDMPVKLAYYLGGTRVILQEEMTVCSEAIFSRTETGFPLHEAIFEVVSSCPQFLRDKMMSTIILEGGTTMMCGFDSRLQAELEILRTSHNNKSRSLMETIHQEQTSLLSKFPTELISKTAEFLQISSPFVVPTNNRKDAVWRGGASLALTPNFEENVCLSKEDYNEIGPHIIHWKCP